MPMEAAIVGTILLVEDDQDLMLTCAEYLKSLGFQVIEASCAEEAANKLATHKESIDIMLSDVVMPGKSGLELCTGIKADPQFADLPIVIISAKADLQDRMAGYNAGADDYITKPIQLPELKSKLANLMEYKKRSQQLKADLKNSQSATQNIMRYYSDMGYILDFFTNSIKADSFKSLSESLFSTLASLQLKAVIQFRNVDKIQHFSSTGAVSPLEASLLHLASANSRFIDHGSRMLVNYKFFSLLIKNMPTNDPDRAGTLKDTLGTLGNMLELKSQMLFTDEIVRNNDLILSTVHKAVDEVGELINHLQTKTQIASSTMAENMENLFIRLGLSETQEEQIRALMQKNQADIDEALEQGMLVKKHFVEIDTNLENIFNSKIR